RALLLALASSIAVAPAATAVATPTAGVASSRADAHHTPVQLPANDPNGDLLPRPVIRRPALVFPSYSLFLDPDRYVVTKEFTFFYNSVPDLARGPCGVRGLFHL